MALKSLNSITGNDNGPGDPFNPWRTLAKLNAEIPLLPDGSEVEFQDGFTDNGTLTINRPGAHPGKLRFFAAGAATINAPVDAEAIVIVGQDIIVEGFHTVGGIAGVDLQSPARCELRRLEIEATFDPADAAPAISGGSGTGYDNIIEHCYIHDCRGDCLNTNGSIWIVRYNRTEDILDAVGTPSQGISDAWAFHFSGSRQNLVYGNVVKRVNGKAGISAGGDATGGSNVLAWGNWIEDVGADSIVGLFPGSTMIAFANVVLMRADTPAYGIGCGLKGTANGYFANNIVVNRSPIQDAPSYHADTHGIFENNVSIVLSPTALHFHTDLGFIGSVDHTAYNVDDTTANQPVGRWFFGVDGKFEDWQALGRDTDGPGVVADMRFAGAGSYASIDDFKLLPDSPLIRSGANLNGFFPGQTDFSGNHWPTADAWDIGAVRYISQGPVSLHRSPIFYLAPELLEELFE